MNLKIVQKAVALAMLMPCTLSMQAQSDLSGNVSAPDKTPVPFAVVGIKNTFLSAQTNSQGTFKFSNLKPGKYVLVTKCVGYKAKTDTVELKESALQVDIVLRQEDVSLDEVLVNATRVDKNSGFAYSNVNAADIKKQNFGQDLPYALNSMPSMVINSDAGNGVGYTGMRIRGTDGTRINVTVNGVPINDAESQGTFFVNMADILSSTNSIQVQRGVGTSANGAGAFGASINMQTNQLNEKAYAEINNSVGSFNTMKNTFAAGTGLINNHFTFDARASHLMSDGYIDRASSKLTSYYLSGGYYGKNTVIKAIMFSGQEKTYQAWYYVLKDSLDNGNRTFNPAGMYYDANGNVHYYNNETDNYRQDNYQLHLIHSFNSKWNLSITGHYTKGKGYYEQYKQGQLLSDYKMPDVVADSNTVITTTDLIRRRWLDNDFTGVIGNLNYKPNSILNFVLGGGYNAYYGRHFGEVIWVQFSNPADFKPVYYNDQANKSDANVYLKTTIRPTDRLTAFIDLQYRAVNYDFLGFDTSLIDQTQVYTSFGFFNPKVGLNYLIGKNTTAYASFGIANKEPNRDDFVNSSRYSRPKAEQLMDIEAGATHQFKNVSLGLNFYNMQYKNQLVLNGQVNDVGAYNRVNVSDSYRRGVEVELNANITRYVSFNGNITLSENKIRKYNEYVDNYDISGQDTVTYNNTDISFSPNVIAAANLTFKPVKNLEISFLNKYVGRQYLDNTSDKDKMIQDYFVTDFRVNYTIYTKLLREINLMAIIYNLSNTRYQTNGYSYSYVSYGQLYKQSYLAPAAPTNFMVGLNLKF